MSNNRKGNEINTNENSEAKTINVNTNSGNVEIMTEEQKRIKNLEDQIAQLTSMLLAQQQSYVTPVQLATGSLDQEVTIIFNMLSGSVRAIFPTWKLYLSEFGEKTVITKSQLQELVNNHRSWFKKEYILLDSKHMDLGENLRIPVYNPDSKKFIKPEDIEKFATMDIYSLEDYYKGLSDVMKNSLENYLFNKCCSKDRNFYNVEKMNTFNRMTKSHLFDNLIMTCTSEYGNEYEND